MSRIQRFRIIFPLLTLFLLWLFLCGIPGHIYSQYRTFFTIIAGIATTISLGISLFIFLPAPKPGDKRAERRSGNLAIFIGVFCIAFFFGYSIFLLLRSTSDELDELRELGVFTIGTVIDGSSLKMRKGDITSITIRYQIKNGTTMTGNVDVPAAFFKNHYLGEQVQIQYSALHPKLIALVSREGNYKMDSGQIMRPLKVADLIHLFELQPGAASLNYLNTVNLKWESMPSTHEGSSIYYNEMKSIG